MTFSSYLSAHVEDYKGELIGYTIGKYGVDIFAGSTLFKGVSALKRLKNANKVCNLEAMLISNANKETILASACKHALERKAFFKNVKIEWGKQEKHIVGKNNYRTNKSILNHANPEVLLRKKEVVVNQLEGF